MSWISSAWQEIPQTCNDSIFAYRYPVMHTQLIPQVQFYNTPQEFFILMYAKYILFSQERSGGDAKRYNDIIRHETLRVAVCDMLEGLTLCPDSLR